MKKIIAAIQTVDDSMRSFAEFSMNLARDTNMPLQLVATQSVPAREIPVIVGAGIPRPDGLMLDKIYERSDNAIRTVVNDLRHLYPNIDYELDFGILPEKIKEYDEKDEALLYLLNRRSQEGFFTEVFGTIETDITNDSKKPVLNVPESTVYTSPQNVLVVLSITEEHLDLRPLIELQDSLGFNPHFIVDLPGIDSSMDNRTKIKHLRSYVGDQYNYLDGVVTIVPDANTVGFIDHIIEGESPDWLAFHKDQKSVWQRLLSNDNINHYILHAQRPVLVF